MSNRSFQDCGLNKILLYKIRSFSVADIHTSQDDYKIANPYFGSDLSNGNIQVDMAEIVSHAGVPSRSSFGRAVEARGEESLAYPTYSLINASF